MSAAQGDAEFGWDYGRGLPPERWHERFPHASGSYQSPVAIERASLVHDPELGQITPEYTTDEELRAATEGFFFKNLHFELEISEHAEAGGVRIGQGDELCRLLNFHIHTPAEHPMDGHLSPMEIHLVHRSPAGKLIVVALFVEEGPDDNPIVAILRGLLPDAVFAGLPSAFAAERARSSLNDGFPGARPYARYEGSLTTPPCSEGVLFYLIDGPISGTARTIREFAKYVPGGNNRPLQAMNGRLVGYYPG